MKNSIKRKVQLPRRRRNIVTHVARNWKEAQEWDLEFWQKQSPQMRIAALEDLRREWEAIGKCK